MGLRSRIGDDEHNTHGDHCSPPAGFREFYEAEFGPQVRRAGLILASTALADDVVQDAFVAVWKRWSELNDPGQYLNRCVMNGSRSVARHNDAGERALRRLRPLTEDEGPVDDLWDALGALGFEERAPIVLRYYGRLSNHEIADALGWPYGSVGPRITKGLRKLRTALR